MVCSFVLAIDIVFFGGFWVAVLCARFCFGLWYRAEQLLVLAPVYRQGPLA